MNWMEINITVTHEAEEAVADVLNSAGAKGVVIEDPLLINQLRARGGWELCDIPEQEHTESVTVGAYYAADDEFAERLSFIEEQLVAIEERIGNYRFGNIRFREVAEEDWEEQWKQYFHVTRVGKSIIIKPSWEDYIASVGDHVIEIDPGMAFGTGTHHTTNMCMECLEEIIKPGVTVFDVGTGSGILSIAAALLGATQVKAVDIDSVAVRVAAENVSKNGLGKTVDVRQGDLLHGTEGEADIIIANILADIVITLLPDVAKKLRADGIFLASGIISERAHDVEVAAAEYGLKVNNIKERAGWVAMQFGKE